MARFSLKPPMLRLSENDVEKQCLDLLRLRRYRPVRLNSGKFKTADNRWITIGEPGIPDYVAIHRAYPGFFLEVKRPGEAPTPPQCEKIAELRLGYDLAVAVIDSMEALLEWLAEHEKTCS